MTNKNLNNENELFADFYEQIKLLKNKKIAFYGASLFLEKFIYSYNLSNYNIIAIIDNDLNKIGKIFAGYRVYKLNDMIYKVDNIIFSIFNNSIVNYSDLLCKNINIKKKLLPNVFEKSGSFLSSLSSNKLYVFDSYGNKEQVTHINGLDIEWLGTNSIVEISLGSINRFKNCKFICGNNSYIKIGTTIHKITNLYANLSPGYCKLIIGDSFSNVSAQIYYGENNKSIIIGDYCMFSEKITILTSDAHTIYNIKTKTPINKSDGITIGNHVWICKGATLLKRTLINDNCVIGASSLVNKKFIDTNCIIAGIPAKIIKRNVNWDRREISQFIES